MTVIKHIPEDFIVEEVTTISPKNCGEYTLFLLKKKNMNTIDALQSLSKIWRIPLKRIGYSGNKDKKAITTQTCSAKGNIKEIATENISVKIIGRSERPVSLGLNKGNKFTITVRNVDKIPIINEKFVNYFGSQRFGERNPEIGLKILKKEYEKVVELLRKTNNEVEEFAEKNPKNFVGAIKTIPIQKLKIYIHSYQSKIWNECVKESVQKKRNIEECPLPGFGTNIAEHPELSEKLRNDRLTTKSFVIRIIPEISSEGGIRKVHCKAENLKVEFENDEIFKEKKKVTLKFFLSKGCYATEFIKQNFDIDF
ncbi:tRNA pseudouridine(13) synthase TruD [Candidatus Woesearchaeota archaeon]|nr:tRNA pseudouridine(13) synthase TruD [Candidatus Woesearchaeota archaeon]